MGEYQIKEGLFTAVNGTNRYGRPLYGPPGLFHVYASDGPEWALSRPGKTGNLLIGIIKGRERKWLIHADKIHAKYTPGVHTHEISDKLLGKSRIVIESTCSPDTAALLIKVWLRGDLKDVELAWAYGGVRDITNDNHDFDTCGYTSESHFFPNRADSENNDMQIDGDQFVVTVPFVFGSPLQGGHRGQDRPAGALHQCRRRLRRSPFCRIGNRDHQFRPWRRGRACRQ